MSRRSGIEASNVLPGPRKRLRGSNNNDNDASGSVEEAAATSGAAAGSASVASGTAAMGAIERKIHSLSLDQLTQSGQRLMDTVMDAIDPSDGAPLHDFFLELPDADDYPDYYEIIKRPVALDAIQHKLDQRAYTSLPDIKHDFETICNNAKRYNLRDTPVWLKARDLHSLIKITYVQIVESLPEPSAAAPPSTTTMPAADQASTSDAPQARPKRILLRSTKSQQKLNEAKSEPQEAAATLPPPAESSVERAHQAADLPSTPARQHSLQPATTVGTPSSQADDDDADADADGDDGWDDANSSKLTKGGLLDGRKRPGKRGKRLKATLRQLVHDLRRVVGTRGYPIVAQFDALPKRSEVPEYYQVVQRPICMRDIEHRVYEKSYINAHALFTDLEQMLNNAMSFYPPESTIWQDAHEIRNYFEREAIPALIQDGFTLEKDDVRQSALPLHLAANSTIEAHKAAYKMIVSKAAGLDPSASQSPEPSSRIRLGSAGVAGSPALPPANALPASSPAPFGSPSPAPGATMSTPGPMPMSTPMSMPMSMPMLPPGPMPTSMSPMAPMHGLPTMPGITGMPIVGSPGRPLQYPGTAATPVASPANLSVRPAATPDSVRRPVGRPPGKGTPTRSNPYPFLERRIGPGRPKKHEAAARQAAIAAHEEMQRKLALQQQQEEMAAQQHAAAMANQPLPQWQQQQLAQQQQVQHQLYMQQQAKQQEQQQQRLQQQRQRQQQQKQQQQQQQQEQQQQQQAMLEQHHYQQQLMQQQQAQHGMPAFSPSAPNQMLPPGAPLTPGQHAAFGAGTMAAEPASPLKRKEALLPAEPSAPLPYEGLENRTPLIASFAIDMEVETPDGQTLAVPSVEVKNASVTQHTLQIPPNASSITIEFPLRMLNRRARAVAPKTEAGEADAEGDVSMADVNGAGHKDAVEEAGKTGGGDELTWPWQPQLWFNGRPASGKWVAADALIDPALLDEQQQEGEETFTTELGCSFCRVRLLPKRGINVFEVSVAPEPSYEPLKDVPAERYSIYFC